MNIYLDWTLTVLYWIALPIYWVLYVILIALLFVLKPLYSILLFLLQPVFYLGAFIAYVAALPYHFLKRFETLYIYLGVGGLIGVACGLLLHFLLNYMARTFNLRRAAPVRGPTAKEHRAAWRKKKLASVDPVLFASTLNVEDSPPRGRQGLLAQTIHEEIDSDF